MRTLLASAASALAFGSTLVLTTPTAHAETGFSANRFEPAERGSEWFVHDSLDIRGKVRPAAGLTLDWSRRALAIYDLSSGDPSYSIVLHRLTANAGASVVLLDRFRLGFNLPIVFLNEGNEGQFRGTRVRPPWNSATVGDLRLGGDVHVWKSHGDALRLAAGAQVWLPTGETYSYTGDGDVRLQPRVQLAGELSIFSYAARVGYLYRARKGTFAEVSIGNELTFGAAFGVRPLPKRPLFVGLEVSSATRMTDSGAFFGTRTTPVEPLLGAHYSFGEFRAGVGAAIGLTHSQGDPQYRLLGSFEWAPRIAETKPAPAPPAPVAPAALPDRDQDGIDDQHDACPDVPGTASLHGCPEAESVVLDADGDGIADAQDACPRSSGPMGRDARTTGCPDSDGDGIADPVDACPDKVGPASDEASKNGCPLAELVKAVIAIRDQVRFGTASADIDGGADGDQVLHAVLEVLTENPALHVRIEGHTDDAGSAATNVALSGRRAKSVLTWLVSHGIDAQRLSAKGLGPKRPLVPNDTDEGRKANRRVEFHVVP